MVQPLFTSAIPIYKSVCFLVIYKNQQNKGIAFFLATDVAESACPCSYRFDLMKYCCMWNFKDRPAYSAIIKLLESYIHLADTKPLSATEHMDISEYRKKAGVPPGAFSARTRLYSELPTYDQK